MPETTLISIREFCSNHELDHTYIFTLKDHGFIELPDDEHFREVDLPRVEKIIRFNRELDINFAGIEVIFHLLEKLDSLQFETVRLRNRLGS